MTADFALEKEMVKIITDTKSIELSDQELKLLLEAFLVYRNKFNLVVSRNFFGMEKTSKVINHLYERIKDLLFTK